LADKRRGDATGDLGVGAGAQDDQDLASHRRYDGVGGLEVTSGRGIAYLKRAGIEKAGTGIEFVRT
ncbi:MAG TPA: hypothetical protein VES73_02205, partial [Lamprocystis sp. (in: g-proteobacteria)]|nr:hypothetical protein [Lamprocystis sp. (in: g-proteobacteria)]